MDYYDDNPLKVNNTIISLKKLRKAERLMRKALKAKNLAELLVQQEKQRAINIQLEAIDAKEKLKTIEIFPIRDAFNWDEVDNVKATTIVNSDNDNDDDDYVNEIDELENTLVIKSILTAQ